MSQPKPTFWTLKKQLRTLLLLSGLTVVLLSLFGGWRLHQFNKKNHELQQTSLTLRKDLEKNFNNALLLTSIRSNLRNYMRSAHPEILLTIHALTDSLHKGLPEKLNPQLQAFVKTLDILEIRMNSFRKNNESIVSIEHEILQTSENLLNTTPLSFHALLRNLSIKTCLKHHHLYIRILLNDDRESLQMTKMAYDEMFTEAEKTIKEVRKQLPSCCTDALKKLQTAYYKLDESVATIIAIRRVTLDTRDDIQTKLHSLRQAVTNESLAEANFLAELTRAGLIFLKKNLIMMSSIMIIIAALGGVTAFFFSQNMVKPLISFTNILKRMTRMLSGLRQGNKFDADFSSLLESMTTQRNNEIGQVVTAVKKLLLRLRELALFRQNIETDESTAEVYQRMARIFSERIQLTSVIIFELSPDGKTMKSVLRRIKMNSIDLPPVVLTDECRARRNGKMIASFKDNHTCALFPKPDTLHHACIPMQISGQIIGLVQFLFLPEEVAENAEKLFESLVDARHYIAEAVPVLHAKRLTLRLQIMATEDPLTGLFNRHYLENSLDRLVAGVLRRESTISVLMCDLDHFKRINDTYGHDAGDLVLNQLSKIFINNVRETDLVIRFGGEEFITLLVDCDIETAQKTAERIRKQVENYKFHIPGNIIRITISIGIDLFPESPDQDIWKTFKHSDIALYQAKDKGRNMAITYDKIKSDNKQSDPPDANTE